MRTSPLANLFGCHRYAVLFYTLILTLAAAPLLTAFQFSGDWLRVFLAFNLLVALIGVPGRTLRALLIGFVAAVVALRLAPASAVGEGLATATVVAGSGLALVAVVSAMRFSLSATVVDAEHIYAALSAYVLGGLFFGVLHWAIASAWPGAYGDAAAVGAAGLPLSTAIYFSFVTLATLGYGDVVPKMDVARGVTVLEAVAGQLYIAVTIARLVGARLGAVGRRP